MSGVQPSGRPWSARMHFDSGAAVATVEADFLAAVNGAWTGGGSALEALFPTGTTLTQTKTEQLALVAVVSPRFTGNKLFAAVQAFDTLTLAGTGTGDSLPDQNALLVSFRTAETGRTNRGRIHLPAPLDSLVTAGAVTSVTAGKCSTAINGVRTNMAAAGHTLVVVTYKVGHTLLPVGRTIPVNHIETDEVVRSQRKRSKRRKAIYV
jgi:hypothetical protein